MITSFHIPDELMARVKHHCLMERLTQKEFFRNAAEGCLRIAEESRDGVVPDDCGSVSDKLLRVHWQQRRDLVLEAASRERFPWLPVLQPGWYRCPANFPEYVMKERLPTMVERAERDEKLRLAKLRWMMD